MNEVKYTILEDLFDHLYSILEHLSTGIFLSLILAECITIEYL
jgi:hypothetical protein